MKKDKALNITIICSLIAVGIHAYLASHYYGLKFGGGSDSVCNINSYLNCDATTASKYASVFGVPVAIWGMFTNLITLMFFSFARLNLTQDNARTTRYGFLLTALIFATSIVMASISVTAIGSLCLFCMSAYLLSLIQFAAGWMSTPISAGLIADDIKETFRSQKWILGSLIAIPALSFLANSMTLDSYGAGDLNKIIDERIAYWQLAPAQEFDSKGLVFQKGSAEPVMTIVEFADYRCSHCKDAYPAIHAFAASHPDVRLIFKTFPLDGTCNTAITGGDGVSCALASISYCAEKMAQKGWAVHHSIYDNQTDFRALPLEAAADKLCKDNGLDCEGIKQCAKSDETLKEIKSMAAEGEKAKIAGTPSIFVNSKILNGGQMLPVLDAAYKKIKAQ